MELQPEAAVALAPSSILSLQPQLTTPSPFCLTIRLMSASGSFCDRSKLKQRQSGWAQGPWKVPGQVGSHLGNTEPAAHLVNGPRPGSLLIRKPGFTAYIIPLSLVVALRGDKASLG